MSVSVTVPASVSVSVSVSESVVVRAKKYMRESRMSESRELSLEFHVLLVSHLVCLMSVDVFDVSRLGYLL